MIPRLKEAKREKNPFNFIWIVFDKDDHRNIAETFHLARTNQPEIKIAYTAVCFEYYILLHFEKTTRSFRDCKEVISYLKRKGYISDYKKASNLFDLLYDKFEDGVQNSEWVSSMAEFELENGKEIYDLSSYSNIHELIDFLKSVVEDKQ